MSNINPASEGVRYYGACDENGRSDSRPVGELPSARTRTYTLDTIGRKIDALIDVLLGRPVKLKPIDLDDVAIAALNAAPGKVAVMPEGERYPHGLPSDDDVRASICAHTKAMDDIYQARNKWMQDHATRGCRTSKHDGELAAA